MPHVEISSDEWDAKSKPKFNKTGRKEKKTAFFLTAGMINRPKNQ